MVQRRIRWIETVSGKGGGIWTETLIYKSCCDTTYKGKEPFSGTNFELNIFSVDSKARTYFPEFYSPKTQLWIPWCRMQDMPTYIIIIPTPPYYVYSLLLLKSYGFPYVYYFVLYYSGLRITKFKFLTGHKVEL
jgi:hypothetical protein